MNIKTDSLRREMNAPDSESIVRNIRVISDLHLENYTHLSQIPRFEAIITPNPDDILCLVGDIGNPFQQSYALFLKWCCQNFGIVLVLAGNHEYYGSSIERVDQRIDEVCRSFGATYLQNRIFVHKNLAFVGTTLWSYIPPEASELIAGYINDYHQIHNFTVERCQELFRRNFAFLEKSIEKLKTKHKVVVLTHHAPLMRGTSFPPFENRVTNCAFASDLEGLVKKVDLWIYGHTHYNHEGNLFWMDNVPLVSNQRGYPTKPLQRYNKDFVVIPYY